MYQRHLHHTKHGFTLIELLMTIAIIGILSSVVLASLTIARQKSRDAKRTAQITQVQRALELYFDAHQSYPSTTPDGYVGADAALQMLAALALLPPSPIPPGGTNPTYLYHGVYADTGGALLECDGGAPVGTVCLSYELGITLERADNVVLDNDADRSVGAFYGALPDCTQNTVGAEKCFDVGP